jgi:hypothetical protein
MSRGKILNPKVQKATEEATETLVRTQAFQHNLGQFSEVNQGNREENYGNAHPLEENH